MQPLNVSMGWVAILYEAIGVSGAPAEKIAGDIDDASAKAGIDAIHEDIEFLE